MASMRVGSPGVAPSRKEAASPPTTLTPVMLSDANWYDERRLPGRVRGGLRDSWRETHRGR